ncbi:head completion/stabilization protein [Halorhodospira neutriphila]|uniref:Phage head completion protein (GPL) n=1 Tax=Halorhodospira neutriphila TaxID=168379 RepID=A0ABS1E5X1_9GAMM|nr:hypothetical protein [Halorhodospira neutriphila]
MVFAPTNDPSSSDQTLSGGWWPDVSVSAWRAATRTHDTVTDERIVEALRTAMGSVQLELDGWQSERQAEGASSLEDVPARDLGGVSALVHWYRSAVYAEAKALVLEWYRDNETTSDGHDRADQYVAVVDSYRREARHAIRRILGRSLTTVELI